VPPLSQVLPLLLLFPLPAVWDAAVELAVSREGPQVCLAALAGAVPHLGAVLPYLPVACKGKTEESAWVRMGASVPCSYALPSPPGRSMAMVSRIRPCS